MNAPDDRWNLPWPRLNVPAYRAGRVGPWALQSVMLLAPKGYFQTSPAGGPRRHTMLVRHDAEGPVTVMSTLPMEIESNAKHVAAATGSVVVMGAGMGLTVHNMLKKPDVGRVTVVEREAAVIDLLQQTTDMESWEGFEKLSCVVCDALEYVPDGDVDFLYADIWDEIGEPGALPETQRMQRNVRARHVGWWGQEIHFACWLLENDHGFPATVELYERWAASIRLPLQGPADAAYVSLIEEVARGYPNQVGLEATPPPAAHAALPPPASEEGLVECAAGPDGGRFTLLRRGNEFGIQVDGRELMASEGRASEQVLATLPCERLADRSAAHVVVGGLGMGFTLRAALDALPADARVTVVEVVGPIVEWNRRHLNALNGDPLSDPRVSVVVADMGRWLRDSTQTFDGILLDVDNGLEQLSLPSNAALYSLEGLATLAHRLRPGGVLAVWSATSVARFEARLGEAGFRTETHAVDAGTAGGPRHVVYLSTRV